MNWMHEGLAVVHIEGEIEVLEIMKELEIKIDLIREDEEIVKHKNLCSMWEIKQTSDKVYHSIEAKIGLNLSDKSDREILKALRLVMYGKQQCERFP